MTTQLPHKANSVATNSKLLKPTTILNRSPFQNPKKDLKNSPNPSPFSTLSILSPSIVDQELKT